MSAILVKRDSVFRSWWRRSGSAIRRQSGPSRLIRRATRRPNCGGLSMELGRLTQAPRPMFASSIPTVFGFSKTQPPMVSWPMSSTAGTVRPCLAVTSRTIIAALPAAPDTASVKSSTKLVLPPGGIRDPGGRGDHARFGLPRFCLNRSGFTQLLDQAPLHKGRTRSADQFSL